MAKSFLHKHHDKDYSHRWKHGNIEADPSKVGVIRCVRKEFLRPYNGWWAKEESEISAPELCKAVNDNHGDKSGGFIALLKVCAKLKDLHQGIQIHHHVFEKGLLKHCCDALITMYSKCGELEKAKELLITHTSSDVFSWTDLIAGYVVKGQGHDALDCFEKMQCEGVCPDGVTYIYVLKACGSICAIKKGGEIHDEIARQGLLLNNVELGNALLDMYIKCRALTKAQQVLKELPVRDVISWSTMIAGYAQQGEGEQALKFLECMQAEGLSPNAVTFMSAIKACGTIEAVDWGKQLHAMICGQRLLEKCAALGNALVHMYAKCRDLRRAQETLESLPVRDVVAWNTLISGFTEHGKAELAMSCFDQMKREGIYPDDVSLICFLKACGRKRALAKGKQAHDEILQLGLLGKNIALGNALVDMYAKCGAFTRAQQALNEHPARNVVSWNALITEYAQHGRANQAFKCFELMKRDGIPPDVITFLSILKACGSIRAADIGEEIHAEITRTGLLSESILLANALVHMYAKCGAFLKAGHLLQELCICDVVSWNALITGYAQHCQCEQAFTVFERMKCEGPSPNEVTFLSLLKACSTSKEAGKGEEVHEELLRLGLLESDDVLRTAVVDMYAKCGAFDKALEVLDMPIDGNIFSWNALISGYVQQGQAEQALACFGSLQQKGVSPDSVTFVCILKACASLGTAEIGAQIHDELSNRNLLGENRMLGNVLLNMYAKCGELEKAQHVFEELPVRDTVSWSTLIAGYVDHDEGEQALDCFEQMRRDGFVPNEMSLLYALKACGSLRATEKGKQFHTEIARLGLLKSDIAFGATLVDMYAKCGNFSVAWHVLKEFPTHNSVCWNALIAGLVQHNEPEQALQCFDQMQSEGLAPDAVTFVCALKICSTFEDLSMGEAVHDKIVKQGLMGNNIVLGNAVIDMYAKCGALSKAQQVFEELPSRDVISWSALIGGHVQQGQGEQALYCFEKMQHEGQAPNLVTFLYILKVCGILGAANIGEQIHTEIARQNLLGNLMISSALVDMYVKCGACLKAKNIITELPDQSAASWNALIAGLADVGDLEQAVSCFSLMWKNGFTPDATTFTCILKAFGCNGLEDDAVIHLITMSKKYGIKLDLQHYSCIVNMLAHAGHFHTAIGLIRKLPIKDHPTALWFSLMGACQKWGENRVARWVFESVVQKES